MFSKKKMAHTPLVMSQEKFDTIIGRHAEIHGYLRLQESVRIDGQVVGNIEAPNDATMSVVMFWPAASSWRAKWQATSTPMNVWS